MNSLDCLTPVFQNLPKELKNTVTKADVFCILSLEQSYYKKSTANAINKTAFLNVVDYIVKESVFSGEDFSKQTVEKILLIKAKLFQ